MLVSTTQLLHSARERHYAVGAFNVYNLEGILAVTGAAESLHSPVMLQLHPAALAYGGTPLVALCLAAAREARVPVSVHLDHSPSDAAIREALERGIVSVMADGSHLPYAENLAFTARVTALVHARGGTVEAELGRLTGTEDELTVPGYEARLTDPAEAATFVARTGIDALAVCIGNVHGPYRSEPRLDFERLEAISGLMPVPLVLHGASGLPDAMVRRAIELGVCKLNVNTELRVAYLAALETVFGDSSRTDLLAVMRAAVDAMRAVASQKLELFGSAGQAPARADQEGTV